MRKDAFEKEDGELLHKVKESDFEIISIERKNGNEFAPNYLI
jgi:DNA topoisomerase-3